MNNEEIINSNRMPNLDLLRLVSIYFMVCIHYIGWGGIASSNPTNYLNYALAGGIALAGNVCVNIFYLLSGYFLNIYDESNRWRKHALQIWIPTLIYSVLIPTSLAFFGFIKLNFIQRILTFVPLLSNQYWFSTIFIATILLRPFICYGIKNMDIKVVSRLVVILILIDIIQPIFGFNAFSNTGYSLLHALTMILLGYWIKLTSFKIKASLSLVAYLLPVVLAAGIIIASLYLAGDRNRTIGDYNSILIVIASIGLFTLFQNLKIKMTIFSKLSPYIFGVYLINDNPYGRDFLWQTILRSKDFYNSPYWFVHFLLSTITFTLFALLIEYLRIKLFKFIQTQFIDRRLLKWLT